MRPGWYWKDDKKIVQHMVFQEGHKTGIAKGLKAVCSERFGEDAIKGIVLRL